MYLSGSLLAFALAFLVFLSFSGNTVSSPGYFGTPLATRACPGDTVYWSADWPVDPPSVGGKWRSSNLAVVLDGGTSPGGSQTNSAIYGNSYESVITLESSQSDRWGYLPLTGRIDRLVELANLLGHESLDTTAIYTQPSADELADDLDRSLLNVYP